MLGVNSCTPIVLPRHYKTGWLYKPSLVPAHVSKHSYHPSPASPLDNRSFVTGLLATSPSNTWSPGDFKKHLNSSQLHELSSRGDFPLWKHASVRRGLCSSAPGHYARGAPAHGLPAGESQEHMVQDQERRSSFQLWGQDNSLWSQNVSIGAPVACLAPAKERCHPGGMHFRQTLCEPLQLKSITKLTPVWKGLQNKWM